MELIILFIILCDHFHVSKTFQRLFGCCQGNRMKMTLIIIFKESIKPKKLSCYVNSTFQSSHRTSPLWPPAMAPQSPTSWTRCRSDQGDRCSSRIMPSLRRWLTLTGQFTFLTFWIDKVRELNLFRERIPERVVHAKGAGAFGYFEVNLFLALSFNSIDEDRKWAPSFFLLVLSDPLLIEFQHVTGSKF